MFGLQTLESTEFGRCINVCVWTLGLKNERYYWRGQLSSMNPYRITQTYMNKRKYAENRRSNHEHISLAFMTHQLK